MLRFNNSALLIYGSRRLSAKEKTADNRWVFRYQENLHHFFYLKRHK